MGSLTARKQLFHLLYDLKWMILASALAASALALPQQVIELYRIMHAERDGAEVANLFVSIFAIACVIWATSTVVAQVSLAQLAVPTRTVKRSARLVPMFLGALPLAACAIGKLHALPYTLPDERARQLSIVGGPWETTARELATDLTGSLGLGALAVLALTLASVSLWRWMTDKGIERWQLAVPGRRDGYALAFAIVAVSAALLACPVTLPRALTVFGIFAVFISLFAFCCAALTIFAMRSGVPIIPVLIILAVVSTLLFKTDNHELRPTPGGFQPLPQPPLASDQFLKWYENRPDLDEFRDEYPVYVVAAQGGGLYAAHQTATFLARMQDLCPRFRDHLFAISSVSGGSVGAGTFASALLGLVHGGNPEANKVANDHAASAGCPAIINRRTPAAPGTVERAVTTVLSQDHLSPLVAAALFPDFVQRFIPYAFPFLDRARALEFSLETELEVGAGKTNDALSRSFLSTWDPARSIPALLMNASEAGSGRRVVISPFVLDRSIAGDPCYQDALLHFPFWKGQAGRDSTCKVVADPVIGQTPPPTDVRLSTAMIVSARFPWVTPAATLSKWHLVDGGYLDNSGVDTALDLIHALEPVIRSIAEGAKATRPLPSGRAKYPRVRIVLIVLTGGGLPEPGRTVLGDILDPIRALLSARAIRAHVAIDRAIRELGSQIPDGIEALPDIRIRVSDVRRVVLSNDFYDLPLGWRMSKRTESIVADQSGRFWDCEPNSRFEQSLPAFSNADCVQQLVSHELMATLGDAAKAAQIANYRLAKDSEGIRIDHAKLMRCFREESQSRLQVEQFRRIKAVLQLWDAHPEITDDRWLAYMLGTIQVETAGLRFFTELGSEDFLVKNAPRGAGNTSREDVLRYRARGFIPIYGRNRYQQFGGQLGIPLEQVPELILNSVVASEVAFQLLFNERANRLKTELNKEPIDWRELRKIVNGGYLGYEEVARYTAMYQRCIGTAKRRG